MAGKPSIRVVVGANQQLFREGMVHALGQAGFDVVATAGDAEDLVRKAHAHHPDVVVTDIGMPPKNAYDDLQPARAIRDAAPGTGVLVLSQFLETRLRPRAGRRPRRGRRISTQGPRERHHRLYRRRAARRGGWVRSGSKVVQRMIERQREDDPLKGLTPREREVLSLMAEGLYSHAVAERFVVSVPAVERNMTRIFAKLGLRQSSEQHRRVLDVLEYLRH